MFLRLRAVYLASTGQPTPLPESEVARFRERLDAGATPDDGVYALLRRLGYSCLAPPGAPKSDPAAREEFQKKSAD